MRRVAAALLLLAALLSPARVAADPPPVRILTIGDSITAAGQWQAELGGLLAVNGVAHVMVNAAVGGTRCDYWPSRIAGLLATHQPDLVTLFCGTNDDVNASCYGESCTSWAWRATVEAIHAWRPATPARVLPAFVQYSDPLIAPQWLLDSEPVTNDRIYGQWVRYPSSWFAGLADLQLVPATADYLDDGGVHPTERGYRVIGRLVYDAARPAMGWPASTEAAPCGLYGHRRGYPRPAYVPCS